MHLDELNVIFGWQVDFVVNIFFRYRRKKINTKRFCVVAVKRGFHGPPFLSLLPETAGKASRKNCPPFRFAAIPACRVCFYPGVFLSRLVEKGEPRRLE